MEELLRAGISWETGDLGAARDNRCLAVRGPGRVGGRAEDPACSIRAFFAFAFAFRLWEVCQKQLGSTGLLR